jgi:ribosome-associated heat shock protein Hsp15
MPAGREGSPDTTAPTQRLDKWLWFARVVKSRTAAAELVMTGKVRVNRVKVERPAAALKVGDVVTVVAHHRIRVLAVRDTGTRRGPPAEARALFNELSDSPAVPSPSESNEQGS